MPSSSTIEKAVVIVGWSAFFISVAGYWYFGKKEVSKSVSIDDKKRAGGLMASAYIGGIGTSTLIVYHLLKQKTK